MVSVCGREWEGGWYQIVAGRECKGNAGDAYVDGRGFGAGYEAGGGDGDTGRDWA